MDADYQNREYLSVGEVSTYTGIDVKKIHHMVRAGTIRATKSNGGQYRFRLNDIQSLHSLKNTQHHREHSYTIPINNTTQTLHTADARNMHHCADSSINLVVTSPPYFNAKMYSVDTEGDLGNIHDLEEWLSQIGIVWEEVFRVLQPGRKFFLNIMNLPVRENKSFRTLNLVGKNIDICENIGFIFKRDIVWHKTNGVRAHFGTYPYPGGILINHMHEVILEFEKPGRPSKKYDHVNNEQRERSKLTKEFWLSLKNSDVWSMKPEKSGSNRTHVAPFPVELPTRLIRAYTFAGEIILDPFAVSGTTLVAAAQWGRNGMGYEINADFCELAKTRIEDVLP